MQQMDVVKRFRELHWEAALPSPEDTPEVRNFKRENLLRALEVRLQRL